MNAVCELSDIRRRMESALSNQMELREILHHYKALTSHFLNIPFSQVLFESSRRLDDESIQLFENAIVRLKNNEPLQHIMGYVEFCGLVINCTKDTLVPRPETEELVHWIIDDQNELPEGGILDLCTGTGCIALALKKNFSKRKVIGLDISDKAIKVAIGNSANLNIPVEWQVEDILNSDTSFQENCFAVWVSNPPYIPNREKEEMHQTVLNFEPHIALFVDNDDPLIFYRKIAEKAYISLKEEGALYFELHENYAKETAELMGSIGYKNVEIRQDLQGKNRMLKATKNKR